ncbi:large conductance mechanosensitive channel protein MscL [Isobaculum melis]|uniref:Large-conductance mechanosensitive channel n=1 Tax=Isobaculum melis TaxID=142588 RepID=A0A1H9RKJ5_9LACT|nr:large conductance mechanosensitive channel protein MscL [Isobaculum melis]SER73184.1 large conductance mechanosensitive channel [Isobaculum melis]
MLKDFKAFIAKGNAFSMAIGIIIGAAFTAVITSLVNDIIMPPIGLLIGNVDFSDLFISLNGESYGSLAAAKAAGAPTLNYGSFINAIISFLIISFVIFMLIRLMTKYVVALEPKPAPEVPTKECPHCLSKIPAAATKCSFCTADLDEVKS